MNVIFLDIDGVLNTPETPTRTRDGRFLGLDPVLVARFCELLARTDARVVLSSTWRGVLELYDIVAAAVPVMDVTPYFPGEMRGTEIASWLGSHPDVERYAIIDDDRDMLPSQIAFFTDYSEGLTDGIVEQICAHFERGTR